MLILREKKRREECLDLHEERLDEMSIRVIGSSEDRLPFKVTIKCPDKGRFDHAHIMKLGTKADEIGAFVITKNPPKSISDLVGYTDGKHAGLKNLTDDQLQALVDWASRRNFWFSTYTNWQTLQYEYVINRKS
jgi:hypothetical protein